MSYFQKELNTILEFDTATAVTVAAGTVGALVLAYTGIKL